MQNVGTMKEFGRNLVMKYLAWKAKSEIFKMKLVKTKTDTKDK